MSTWEWSREEEEKIQELIPLVKAAEIPYGSTARAEAIRRLQRLKKAKKWPERKEICPKLPQKSESSTPIRRSPVVGEVTSSVKPTKSKK